MARWARPAGLGSPRPGEHLAWSGLGHRLRVREEDAAAARSILYLPQSDELELLHRYVMDTQSDIPQGALLSAGIFGILVAHEQFTASGNVVRFGVDLSSYLGGQLARSRSSPVSA